MGRRGLADVLLEEQLDYVKQFEETLDAKRYRIWHGADMPVFPYLQGAPQLAGCTVDNLQLRCTVPPDHYFLMGDNRDNCLDSRMFGVVPAKFIVGKLLWRSGTEGGAI